MNATPLRRSVPSLFCDPLEERATMSRNVLGFAAAILISLPCAAMADIYPNAVVSPGAAPQRLSPRQVFRWLDTQSPLSQAVDHTPWASARAWAFARRSCMYS